MLLKIKYQSMSDSFIIFNGAGANSLKSINLECLFISNVNLFWKDILVQLLWKAVKFSHLIIMILISIYEVSII